MLFRNTHIVCQCFGHADECFYNPTINGSQCICNNNTEGVMCHDCAAGFYRDPTMLYTEACISKLYVRVYNASQIFFYFMHTQIVVVFYRECPIL